MKCNEVVIFKELSVEITYRKTTKLRLYITQKGVCKVSTTYFTSKKQIIKMIEDNYDYLLKSVNETKDKLAKKQLKINGSIYIFGKPYTITQGHLQNLLIDHNKQLIFWQANLDINVFFEHLKKLFYDELIVEANKSLSLLTVKTNLFPSKLKIKDVKSKYGSMNIKTGSMVLALSLIHFPKFVLEYVIIHELCHLVYPNHGLGFKQLLASFLPNFKEIEQFIKKNSNNLTLSI